ncbi:hypothetical protein KKK_11395 [Pseudomonas putida B6-2]|nr:hypothetical protein KKK_11395 [Pseudomonas putida B6-2]
MYSLSALAIMRNLHDRVRVWRVVEIVIHSRMILLRCSFLRHCVGFGSLCKKAFFGSSVMVQTGGFTRLILEVFKYGEPCSLSSGNIKISIFWSKFFQDSLVHIHGQTNLVFRMNGFHL